MSMIDRPGLDPYWRDETRHLVVYHADFRDIVPHLDPVDLILTDPPYGQTALAWDRWPDGWCAAAAQVLKPTGSMWCFGTLRMFMEHAAEFTEAGFALAQDIAGHSIDLIWEKHNGSGFHADRFRRVHEQAAQFYLPGMWSIGDPRSPVYRDVQHTYDGEARKKPTRLRRTAPPHYRTAASSVQTSDGRRQMRSVLQVRSMHGKARNETEKPTALILPIMRYACPPGGVVLDMFCGSGAVLEVAGATGRAAIGIDIREEQCEIAARRLETPGAPLFAGSPPGSNNK